MKRLSAALFAALLVAPIALQAQVSVGPFAAYHGGADFGVGGYVAIPLEGVNENLSFNASLGYFFPDGASALGTSIDVSYWEINGDAVFRFPMDGSAIPFVLGGLNIARGSASASVEGFGEASASETDIGINIGGGVSIPQDSFNPFVGAKYEVGGGDDFAIFFGVGIPVGN